MVLLLTTQKAIEIDPSAFSYAHRGDAKRLLKDYNGAIADYTKSIEIDPDSIHRHYSRTGYEAEEMQSVY